jgi:hypothetical protein
MSERASSRYRSAGRERGVSGGAVGLILFASMMMILAGSFQALTGLVAVFENEFYVATRNYLFQFDVTTWGWIHLLVGLIVAARHPLRVGGRAGQALLAAKPDARGGSSTKTAGSVRQEALSGE